MKNPKEYIEELIKLFMAEKVRNVNEITNILFDKIIRSLESRAENHRLFSKNENIDQIEVAKTILDKKARLAELVITKIKKIKDKLPNISKKQKLEAIGVIEDKINDNNLAGKVDNIRMLGFSVELINSMEKEMKKETPNYKFLTYMKEISIRFLSTRFNNLNLPSTDEEIANTINENEKLKQLDGHIHEVENDSQDLEKIKKEIALIETYNEIYSSIAEKYFTSNKYSKTKHTVHINKPFFRSISCLNEGYPDKKIEAKNSALKEEIENQSGEKLKKTLNSLCDYNISTESDIESYKKYRYLAKEFLQKNLFKRKRPEIFPKIINKEEIQLDVNPYDNLKINLKTEEPIEEKKINFRTRKRPKIFNSKEIKQMVREP